MYPQFASGIALQKKIDRYFNSLVVPATENPSATAKPNIKKMTADAVIPSTLSGLALYLGFESRQSFEEYERNGTYADILKRARLRIEAEYEKKLHYQSSAGAIFALKTLGWNEPNDNTRNGLTGKLEIEIINTPNKVAGTENDVEL